MKSRVEQYQTGKGWIKPIFYAAESWASWAIIFDGIYDLYDPSNEAASRAPYTPRVYQVIRFLFFLVVVVCLEKMLIQAIAYNFHQTAYKERLDTVNNAIEVLDHLKDYRPKRKVASGTSTPSFGFKKGFGFGGASAVGTPMSSGGEGEYFKSGTRTPADVEEGWLGDSDEKQGSSSKGKNKEKKKRESGGGWFMHAKTGSKEEGSSRGHSADEMEMKQHGSAPGSTSHSYPPSSPPLVNHKKKESEDGADGPGVVRTAARAIKAVVLHDARNIRGDDDKENGEEEGAATGMMGMNSAHQAKKLARDLYHAFRADRKRTYLIPSDFYPAYSTPEEAKDAFRVFDKDDNGDITRAEIKTTVVKVYKERRFLARSLRDVSAAVTTLDRIMLVAAMIILFFISLSVFGVSIGSSLSSIYTVFIAASFIFKSAASNAFDSIMFLFVTHPFDTGDRCFIDNENLVVRKMGLFATTFTRADGSQTYYFNSMLFTKFINNARRSGNMFEACEMQVNWKTPLSKLDALEKLLNDWIQNDEKRWYVPGVSYVVQKIEFQRSMEVTIGIGHNGTWQDWGMRLARKTAFHAAVQYYANQLGITWSESPQPILFTDKGKEPFLPDDEVDIVLEPEGGDGNAETPRTPTMPTGGSIHRQGTASQQQHAMLGFMPPAGKSGLRMRKSKHKKALAAGNADA
ncbi:hypothetical protein FRC03_003149 [Tulasnella sp. 419]|nr:hypothetical protein FRC03_003149 [Tulasnella sp. 419]